MPRLEYEVMNSLCKLIKENPTEAEAIMTKVLKLSESSRRRIMQKATNDAIYDALWHDMQNELESINNYIKEKWDNVSVTININTAQSWIRVSSKIVDERGPARAARVEREYS